MATVLDPCPKDYRNKTIDMAKSCVRRVWPGDQDRKACSPEIMVCLFDGEKRFHVSREKGPFWNTIVGIVDE